MKRTGKFKNIIFVRKDRTAVVTINRPEVKNAIDLATMEEMERALSLIEKDREILALIVTGSGNESFVSGGDLKYFQSLDSRKKGRTMSLRMQAILARLEGLDIPVIAALNGYAFGGGWEVAVACDIRIASEDAKIGFKQVSFGLMTGWGGASRLVRTVGRSRALLLLLTGDAISAREAHDIGLVDKVVRRGLLMEEVGLLAATITSQPPLSVRSIKMAIHGRKDSRTGQPVTSARERARYETELFSELWDSQDHREAVKAFFEKRVPLWRGR